MARISKVKILNPNTNEAERLRQEKRIREDPTLTQQNVIQQKAQSQGVPTEAFKKADETKQQFQDRFQNAPVASQNLTAEEIAQKNRATEKIGQGEQAIRESINNIPSNQLTPSINSLIPAPILNHAGIAKDFLQGVNNVNQELYDAIYGTILSGTLRVPVVGTINPINHLESNLKDLKTNVDEALKDYQSGTGSYADVATALLQYGEAARKLGDYSHLINKSAVARYNEGGQSLEIEYANTQKFIDSALAGLTAEATARINRGTGA